MCIIRVKEKFEFLKLMKIIFLYFVRIYFNMI